MQLQNLTIFLFEGHWIDAIRCYLHVFLWACIRVTRDFLECIFALSGGKFTIFKSHDE